MNEQIVQLITLWIKHVLHVIHTLSIRSSAFGTDMTDSEPANVTVNW